MKLFVNTKTQECGMYDPSDLDDDNWIEAPKGTQAVYYVFPIPLFYKVDESVLMVFILSTSEWHTAPFTIKELTSGGFATYLWGTLQDFDL